MGACMHGSYAPDCIYPGMTLYGLSGVAVLTGPNSQVEFTVSSALLFGTICAAVDPVAVSMV